MTRRGLDRAVDLAAVRLARSAAGPERRRQCAPAARDVAGQPLHAALQLQRLEPRADDSHARRRAPSRDAPQSSRTEPEPRAEGPRGRPVRSAARRARRGVLPHAEGGGQPCAAPPNASDRLRPLPRVLRGQPDRARRHQLPLGSRQRAARIAHDEPAHARAARRARLQRRTARSATTRFCASCRVPTGRRASRRPIPACRTLAPHERVAEAQYEHQLGNVQRSRRRQARRRSRIRPARTGITRTRTAPRTIRSPAASPASSSSKATSTTRSIGR